MERRSVALFVHPFKNKLLSREELRGAVRGCMEAVEGLVSRHAAVRLNVVVPGYVLECLDGMLLSKLREQSNEGLMEWLVSGYSEPFLSLSPPWLSRENIRAGVALTSELVGVKPVGYHPPFSNWEPFCTPILREAGFSYVALSNSLFPAACRTRCGYWTTEHLGTPMVLMPMDVLHDYNAPAQFGSWLAKKFSGDPANGTTGKVACVQYLMPLIRDSADDAYRWLRDAVKWLNRNQQRYPMVRFSDYLSDNQPLGLQYLPPSLDFGRDTFDNHVFLNWLFGHDQVGLLHRRMMEVCDAAAPKAAQRSVARQVRELFAVQDINRFLPGTESGFHTLRDRLWTYRKLIEVERHLNDRHRLKGGQIRIVDHLRNGNKSIIMTNRSLKAYINHRRGGSIFELDFVARGMNVTAGYASQRHTDPSVIEAGRSKMAFVDHLVAPQTTASDFVGGTMSELGDFVQGWYEYKVMKSKAGVKAMLSRQGSVVQGEKSCPLTMEKVFGFEGDRADLSFVYQLGNQTVTPYRFVFATEMTFSLGGAVGGKALLRCGKEWYGALARERVFLEGVTEVALEDSQYGIRVLLKTQKPVQVWCYPVGGGAGSNAAYQGTTLVIALPVTLGANSLWSLMGKLMLRGIRRK